MIVLIARNFQFVNPTKIIFRKGEIIQLSKEIPLNSKVLALYGGGSVPKSGLLQTIKDVLQNFYVGEFGGIEPNPTYETPMKAEKAVKILQYGERVWNITGDMPEKEKINLAMN